MTKEELAWILGCGLFIAATGGAGAALLGPMVATSLAVSVTTGTLIAGAGAGVVATGVVVAVAHNRISAARAEEARQEAERNEARRLAGIAAAEAMSNLNAQLEAERRANRELRVEGERKDQLLDEGARAIGELDNQNEDLRRENAEYEERLIHQPNEDRPPADGANDALRLGR